MKNLSRMRPAVLVLVIGVLAIVFPAITFAEGEKLSDYRYCHGAPEGGTTYYFSQTFSVPRDTNPHEIDKAFNAYVNERFNDDVEGWTVCMGPYDTAEESNTDLNSRRMNLMREGRWRIVMFPWRYEEHAALEEKPAFGDDWSEIERCCLRHAGHAANPDESQPPGCACMKRRVSRPWEALDLSKISDPEERYAAASTMLKVAMDVCIRRHRKQ